MKPITKKTPRRKHTPTLRSAFVRYEQEVSIKKRSHLNERSLFRAWLKTQIADRQVGSIFASDIIRIRDEWMLSFQPATVTRRLAVLSHLFTTARKEWGMVNLANPVELVTRPVVQNGRTRRLYERIKLRGVSTDECPTSELQWLINATRSKELPTIMLLASETSMRRGEIAEIRRENIDLVYGTVFLAMTKNGESRIVPLSPFAKHVLKSYVQGKPHRGKIFTLTPGAITRAFIRARDRARLRYEALCQKYGRRARDEYFIDLRFHDLRHDSTSRLATAYEMHQLAKVTGHKDTRMLLRYYHPDGLELVTKLNRSTLGKRQLEKLRQHRHENEGDRNTPFDPLLATSYR